MSNKIKRNKVYGLIGLGAYASFWNADTDGNIRKIDFLSDNDIQHYATDKALKYAIKRFWQNRGKEVFGLKEYNFKKNKNYEVKTRDEKIQDSSIKILNKWLNKFAEETNQEVSEIYEELKIYGQKNNKANNAIKALLYFITLFTNKDIRNFGIVFTGDSFSFNLTGAAQFTYGFNKLKDPVLVREEEVGILSYTPSSDQTTSGSTMGAEKMIPEAHYFYGLSVIPNEKEYEMYLDILKGLLSNIKTESEQIKSSKEKNTQNKKSSEKVLDFLEFLVNKMEEGELYYSEEDFKDLYEASLYAVSELTTTTKAGVVNEFALFVHEKEGENLYLPTDLYNYIEMEVVKDDKGIVVDRIIDLSKLIALINDNLNKIEKVEILHNKYKYTLKTGQEELNDKFVIKNIFTPNE